MDLNLYRVAKSGSVKLGDLATGVEFFTAEKADNGTITLTPVNIVSTRSATPTKSDAVAALPQDQPIPGTEPPGTEPADREDDDEPWDGSHSAA